MEGYPHVEQPDLELLEKGYSMKGRLLRPSMVGVTRFNVEDTKKDQENKDNHDAKK